MIVDSVDYLRTGHCAANTRVEENERGNQTRPIEGGPFTNENRSLPIRYSVRERESGGVLRCGRRA